MENFPKFSIQSLFLEVLEGAGYLNFQTKAHLHHLPKCGIVCARGRSSACALSSDSHGARGVQAAEAEHGREQTPQVWDQKEQEIHRKKRKRNASRSLNIICFCPREFPTQNLWEFKKLFWDIYIPKHKLLAGGKKIG